MNEHQDWMKTFNTDKQKGQRMNTSKHKLITRLVWTRKGVAAFEKAVNDAIATGWDLGGIEYGKGTFRILCTAMMHKAPEKCDCECPCCLEMHQGSCNCQCDCCLAHSHRDGSYPTHDEDEE